MRGPSGPTGPSDVDPFYQAMRENEVKLNSCLTMDDLFILAVEECSEVTQAICKVKRFGLNRSWPGYGNNREELSKEVGDLLGVLKELPIDWDVVRKYMNNKLIKADKAKREAHADGHNGQAEIGPGTEGGKVQGNYISSPLKGTGCRSRVLAE